MAESECTGRLVAALVEAGASAGLVADARRDLFHVYRSELTFPEIALVERLRLESRDTGDPNTAAKLLSVLTRVVGGEFDAGEAEAREWAASPEGVAAFRELLGSPMPRRDGP